MIGFRCDHHDHRVRRARPREALSPAPFLDAIRAQAFEAFEALPIPSQETEEWRYTDLEGFGFDLRPFVEGGRAENLDQVPEEILAAAGQVGERAGLQIQRNSEVMVTHLDPALAGKGVWFGDLDRAIAERPELVEPYLHALVPADRSKFTALHAAFRSGGRSCTCRPASRSSCRCRR